MDILGAILLLFAGVGVFIVGMNILGEGLERSAGGSLKRMLGKIGSNRFVGVGIGAGATAIIQSSSATSVMVIGFVNAGIMTLYQAASILMGANIGTTITGIIVSLKSLPISDFAMLLAFVGVMMTFIKMEKVKQIGGILSGFGLIFVGLELMGNALSPDNCPELTVFFQDLFKAINFPLLLILCGIVFTALIQSSSAATGIFITMVSTGALNLDGAVFLILGSNIGTCVTAVLACIGASTNAKRTALIHLAFNLIGTILFTAVLWIFKAPAIELLSKIPGGPAMQLAWFHVIFNLSTTLVLLPFVKQLVQFATFVIRDKKEQEEVLTLRFVDERFIKTPAIALMQVKKEIEYMGQLVKDNVLGSFDVLSESTKSNANTVAENERVINFTNNEVTKYLVKLSSHVDEIAEVSVGAYFHVLNDLERIGDHAENFCEIGLEMQEKALKFSNEAEAELREMKEKVVRMFEIAMTAFTNGKSAQLEELAELENQIDGLKKELSARHYARLAEGKCTVEHSPYYTSLIVGLERVADHLINVGYSVLNPTGSQAKTK